MIRKQAERLEAAIRKLERTGSVNIFASEFADILDAVHLGAVYEGRALAGVEGRIDVDDRELAREMSDYHAEFAESFLDDIDDGRYTRDGKLSGKGIRHRAAMYLDTARGTASESFVAHSEPDEEWDWVLGAAEHCSDCLKMAGFSPLRTDELWTHPGMAETDCRHNCHCRLVRKSDGVEGFEAVNAREFMGADVSIPEPKPFTPAEDPPVVKPAAAESPVFPIPRRAS